jgi:hypothetical protein
VILAVNQTNGLTRLERDCNPFLSKASPAITSSLSGHLTILNRCQQFHLVEAKTLVVVVHWMVNCRERFEEEKWWMYDRIFWFRPLHGVKQVDLALFGRGEHDSDLRFANRRLTRENQREIDQGNPANFYAIFGYSGNLLLRFRYWTSSSLRALHVYRHGFQLWSMLNKIDVWVLFATTGSPWMVTILKKMPSKGEIGMKIS